MKLRKLTAFLLVFALVFSCIPSIESQAKSKAKTPKLNKTKVTLVEGKTTKLTVKNSGKVKVKWSTSNKKVAKVSKGKVTAVKKGTAKVKAKVSGKTLTCMVTVKAKAKATTEATTEAKTTEKKTEEKPKTETPTTPSTPSTPNVPSEDTTVTETETTWNCNTQGHKMNEVVKVQPTCTTMGTKYDVCEICGVEWFKSYIPATGHGTTHQELYREATCGQVGFINNICDTCDTIVSMSVIPNDGIEHQYEIVDSMEADLELQPGYSYLRQGYIKYQCKVCNDKYTEYFNPCYHHYTRKVVTEATCSREGLAHDVCSDCGYETYSSIAKNSNHNLIIVTEEPSCVHNYKTYSICQDCGLTRTVATHPQINHNVHNGVCSQCGLSGEELANTR